MRGKPIALVAVTTAVVLGVAFAAHAAWSSSGTAPGSTVATSVNTANAPAATRGASTVGLSWVASTLASGAPVGRYDVLRHSGATTTTVCSGVPATSCTDLTPLPGAVTYGVIARIGANWVGAESPLTPFTFDVTAPSSTLSTTPSAPNGTNGWFTTNVGVTINASDPGGALASGVKEIRYSLNGGATSVVPGGTASFTVSAEGTTSISYWAVDNAGNTETRQPGQVKLDKTAPVSSASLGGGSTVTLSASDAQSGVASIVYKIGAAPSYTTYTVPFTLNPGQTVAFHATDAAGNVESPDKSFMNVVVDSTPPVTTLSTTPSAPNGLNGWFTANVPVTLTATDTGSGASGVKEIRYSLNGGGTVVVTGSTASFTVSTEGTTSISYWSVDNAGNTEATKSGQVKLDKTTPVSTITPASSTTVWNTSSSVSIGASDATSGVAQIRYKVNGAATYTTYTGAFTLPEGTNTVTYHAVDSAGNAEADRTATIRVDTVLPTVTMTYPVQSSTINNGHWGDGCAQNGLCGTAADGGSGLSGGVASYELKRTSVTPNTCWSGSAFTSAACGSYQSASGTQASWAIAIAFSSVPNGTYELRVKVIDNAGNSNRAGSTPSGSPDATFTK